MLAGSAEKANEVVANIEANGGQAIAMQADIGKTADIQHLFDQTIEHFGQVDILVNNAGTKFYKAIAQVTEEEFDKIFAINVKGTFFACQQAAQRMADGGRIINFSTTRPLAKVIAGLLWGLIASERNPKLSDRYLYL